MPDTATAAFAHCGRCGIRSGEGYLSQHLTRQQYRIRRPQLGQGVEAMRLRLAGWYPSPAFKDGWYLYDLMVCEKCLDAPVRTSAGGKTWTLWEPRNPPKRPPETP